MCRPRIRAHEEVYRLLKERRVLESFKGILSPLRLPRTLRLKVEGCDGVSNAWYEDDAVTVCYEYLQDVLQNAPKETTPARRDARGRPGRADRSMCSCTRSATPCSTISAFRSSGARRTLQICSLRISCCSSQKTMRGDCSPALRIRIGSKWRNRVRIRIRSRMYTAFRAQRFYNVMCMAYGADPKVFAVLVDDGHLPKDRAEWLRTRVSSRLLGQ